MTGGVYPECSEWTMRWLALLALVLLGCAILLAVGCSAQGDYVRCDRLTYDAIAPVYSGYVSSDPALADEAKDRRHRLLESWRARIVEAERE